LKDYREAVKIVNNNSVTSNHADSQTAIEK